MSEARRSGRATKGQHKSHDLLDQPAEVAHVKKKAAKKGTAKNHVETEEAANDIIRCICGATQQDDDSAEEWICCEKCNAWQHNICMGITIDEQKLKELTYFCEECKPEDHKETLEAIARGEKPWEQRAQAYADSLLPKASKPKKAKGKRQSDVKIEPEKNSKTPTPDVLDVKNDDAVKPSNGKRKAEEPPAETVKAKVRKQSLSGKDGLPFDIPPSIEGLPAARQPAARLLLKNLTAAMKISRNTGVYEGSDPELDARATRLALEIERVTYDAHAFGPAYGGQMRTMCANVKTNQELCDRLVRKTLTPRQFSVMSVSEMASKEQRAKTAEMKARSDKQSIMVTDDGPRTRKTHKGEEMVGSDNGYNLSEDMPAIHRRRQLDPNADMAVRSRENSIGDGGDGNGNELPREMEERPSTDDIRANAVGNGELSNSPPPPPLRKQPSSVATNFDINKVFDKVNQSPTMTSHVRKPSGTIQPPPAREGPGEDAEIDKMLEDGNESPPYSPKEFDDDPSIVWRGQMLMNSVAQFAAIGRYVGGANLSAGIDNPIPFADLIPNTLSVAGRIQHDHANEYLCSLRFSPNTDITVLALEPSGSAAREEFIKLYDYFIAKKRYGVVGDKSFANVRDTYLIPVPAGNAALPEFVHNLAAMHIPAERPEPLILVTLVIRQNADVMGNAANSPAATGPTYPRRQMSMSGPTGPAMSPLTSQGSFTPTPSQLSQPPHHANPQNGAAFATPTPPAQQHGRAAPPPSSNGEHPQQTNQQHNALNDLKRIQLEGEKVAAEILGDMYSAPTVGFLLPQAHKMTANEWAIINEILVADELARIDLPHLSKLLESRNPPTTAVAGK